MFERIEKESDLLLPKIYEKIINLSETKNNPEFIKKIYTIYKNDAKYIDLLNQMINIPDIPIEILSKYYIRMYSLEGDFAKKMNNDLLTNCNNNILYQPFIKTLYEGLKIGIFNIVLGLQLFSAQTLSINELLELWKYKDNFKENKLNGLERDLPKPIIISKSFITFTKDMKEAEKYLRFGRNVILTIINSEKEQDLYTHADIERLSYFPNEKEVLFFPFSVFGIDDLEYDQVRNIYNLKLIYFGKFNKLSISNKKINNYSFKNNLLKTGLLENEKINSINMDDFFTKIPESKCCCRIY